MLKESIETSGKDSSDKGLVTIYVRKKSVSKQAKDNECVKIFNHSPPLCIYVRVCVCMLVHVLLSMFYFVMFRFCYI